ncbi:MAG: hypothetical protein U0744_08425 [Gemmataceae bacterium]
MNDANIVRIARSGGMVAETSDTFCLQARQQIHPQNRAEKSRVAQTARKSTFAAIREMRNRIGIVIAFSYFAEPERKGIGNGKRKIGFSVGFFRFPSSRVR